jgi:hypothetical protein
VEKLEKSIENDIATSIVIDSDLWSWMATSDSGCELTVDYDSDSNFDSDPECESNVNLNVNQHILKKYLNLLTQSFFR